MRLTSNWRLQGHGYWVILTALIATLPLSKCFSADTNETRSSSCPVGNYFSDWFDRVDHTRTEQPHWASPMATVSPLLLELFRYDVYDESLTGGRTLTT